MGRAVVLSAAILLFGCNDGAHVGKPPAPEPEDEPSSKPTAGAPADLTYEVPKEWKAEPPAMNLRKAQYRVQDRDGQEAAAEMIVFFFSGRGGTVEANLARARGQVSPEDESPEAKQETFKTGPFEITLLDVHGTYTDQLSGTSTRDSRMLWAFVETAAGQYFFKLVGPRGTVSDWSAEFVTLLKSLKPVADR